MLRITKAIKITVEMTTIRNLNERRVNTLPIISIKRQKVSTKAGIILLTPEHGGLPVPQT